MSKMEDISNIDHKINILEPLLCEFNKEDKMSRKSFIYAIENNLDGKIYIGKSVNPKTRWRQHKRNSEYIDKKSMRIHRAINKHGINNFTFKVLYNIANDYLAYQAEEEIITDYVNSGKGSLLYNTSFGGMGVFNKNLPWVPKKDMSGKNHPLYGKPRTDEVKRKLREKHLGMYKLPPLTKEQENLIIRIYNEKKISCNEISREVDVNVILVERLLDPIIKIDRENRINEIREAYNNKMPVKDILKKFLLCEETFNRIINDEPLTGHDKLFNKSLRGKHQANPKHANSIAISKAKMTSDNINKVLDLYLNTVLPLKVITNSLDLPEKSFRKIIETDDNIAKKQIVINTLKNKILNKYKELKDLGLDIYKASDRIGIHHRKLRSLIHGREIKLYDINFKDIV